MQNRPDGSVELIEKARSGDLESFQKLIDLYKSRIYGIAYQIIGNSDDAEDIAQEVFLRLYRSLKKYDARHLFSTWLYRMTVNLAIDYRRRNARHNNISIDAVEGQSNLPGNRANPDTELEKTEFKGIIKKITENLAENQRKVFILRDMQEFSVEEIAKILECRQSTVRVHLARARANVKKALYEYYPNIGHNR